MVEPLRFQTNARMMLGILGDPAEGIFTAMRCVTFALPLYSKNLPDRILPEVEELLANRGSGFFPDGLYRHFAEVGFPSVPSSMIDRATLRVSFGRNFTQASELVTFGGRFACPYCSLAKMTYQVSLLSSPARCCATALPGLPPALNSRSTIFKTREYAGYWREHARRLLAEYDAMQQLDGIMHGAARLTSVAPDHRFGVSHEVINDLERYAEVAPSRARA